MMLTLAASSLRSLLKGRGTSPPKLPIVDLPKYTREELGLHGLTMTTDLLAGATRDTLAALRDAGDKCGCACLVLADPDPLPVTEVAEKKAEEGVTRITRVLEAASLLGCNAASVRIKGRDDDAAMERAIERLKPAVERAERLEINLLIRPSSGLTATSDRMIHLVKSIGGFRIGTMPDFEDAAASEDPGAYLRRLTPYASALLASVKDLTQPDDPLSDDGADDKPLELDDLMDMPAPEHEAYDLKPLVEAVTSVGYDQTLALDFRGKGDGTLGVILAREAFEAVFERLSEES